VQDLFLIDLDTP